MLARIRDNLLALEQGAQLLDRLDDAAYRRAMQPVFGSSIGAHMRHNLDHYACLLDGIKSGAVDYGARERKLETEQDRAAARHEFARIARALAALDAGAARQATLRVRREADENAEAVASSLERELDFLMSHTIHHYAIVAILCRLQAIEIPDDFGVAPSTLRFRERERAGRQTCAR